MSRVYFHSPSGEAELWGGEYQWLGNLCADVTLGVLNLRSNWRPWPAFIDATGHNAYLAYPGRDGHLAWLESLATAITVSGTTAFAWKGRRLDMFQVRLNTATRIGGRPLRLAARIYGQGDIHLWFDGFLRSWVAEIITEGLESGVFRTLGDKHRDESWEHVREFLLSRDDEPVVLSYSVERQFPNWQTAGWKPPEGTDLTPDWAKKAPDEWAVLSDDHKQEYYEETISILWADLGHDEQWRIAMEALRAKPGGLRLSLDGFESVENARFGHGLSAFDLIAPDYADRLNRALLGDGQHAPAPR